MRGERSRGERNRVLEHKRKACVETEACIGHMADKLNRNVLPEKTPCNACKAVVHDIDWLLFREKEPVPRRKRLAMLLEDICGDIAIRHDDSNYLEELCDDLENHRAVEWLRAADDRQDGDVVVMEYESLDDIKTNGGVFWEKVKEMTLYEHQQKVSRARRPRARRDPPQVRCGTPAPPYIGGLRQRGSRRAVRGRP